MTLPENVIELPGGNRVEVVGESNYLAVFERAFGPRAEDGIRATVLVCLVAETSNPYDPNAVAVTLNGETCGYIPRLVAPLLAPVMAAATARGKTVVCNARVRGGWSRPDDTGEFGVVLDLGAPAELLAAIERGRDAEQANLGSRDATDDS